MTDAAKQDDTAALIDMGRPQDKPTFDEMRRLLGDEIARIGIVQRHLVESGCLDRPDPGQMRRKVVYGAVVDLIDIFEKHRTEFVRVIRDAKSRQYRNRAGP